MPELLTVYRPMRVEQLDGAGQQTLARMFHGVSLPAEALQALRTLVNDDPVDAASLAGALAQQDWLWTGWLAAARAARHPPSAPRDDLARAIDNLGLPGARGLAFACVLRQLFAGGCPRSRQRLATLGGAAAIACLLVECFAQALQRRDGDGLQARVALAWVGPMALVHRLPQGLLHRLPREGFLQRCVAEQALLGVSSAEIGRLSMREWGLPETVVDDACQVDAVLFAPHAAWTPARASSLALCYLATRLGERLAEDPGLEPSALDPLDDADPAMHQLRGYLRQPGLQGVCEVLRTSELARPLRRLRGCLAHASA